MENVTLKVSIGSFSVEVTGPAEFAEKKLEELISRYLTGARSLPSAGESPKPIPFLDTRGKKLSPAEFLRRVAHGNQRDLALALAYYLEKFEGVPSFTTTELGELGRRTKYPFGNVSDVVSKLVSRGLMMSAGEKEGQRAYALTASGEEYVESIFKAE